MKSKIVKSKEKNKYPKLMKFPDKDGGSFVVLFTEQSIGTIVASRNVDRPLGHLSRVWVMSEFNTFNDNVVLTND